MHCLKFLTIFFFKFYFETQINWHCKENKRPMKRKFNQNNFDKKYLNDCQNYISDNCIFTGWKTDRNMFKKISIHIWCWRVVLNVLPSVLSNVLFATDTTNVELATKNRFSTVFWIRFWYMCLVCLYVPLVISCARVCPSLWCIYRLLYANVFRWNRVCLCGFFSTFDKCDETWIDERNSRPFIANR